MKNYLPLLVVLIVSGLAGADVVAQDAGDADADKTADTGTDAGADSDPDTDTGEEDDSDDATDPLGESPESFIPSEEVSADHSISFPVDI